MATTQQLKKPVAGGRDLSYRVIVGLVWVFALGLAVVLFWAYADFAGRSPSPELLRHDKSKQHVPATDTRQKWQPK